MRVIFDLTMSIYLISAALLPSTTSFTFHHSKTLTSTISKSWKKIYHVNTARLLSSDGNNVLVSPESINISRLSKLQTLLQKAGAPGSKECNLPNDLEPVSTANLNLHPHLHPIAQSKSNPDHYICGLRRAYADDAMYESSTNSPWPIVESKVNGMGYNLLSLNSEHMMRRIVAQADSDRDEEKDTVLAKSADELMHIYNEGLGSGNIVEKTLDVLYEPGSVSQLGYGASKYVLLRVGPFPDLYEEMANNHAAKNDESSSLIAAEASNGKFTGFARTFRFYAELLNSFPNRSDEIKDAARVCLRMPLPSIGLSKEDFVHVAELADLPSKEEDVLKKMEEMYNKIKAHEEEDEQSRANMTPEQRAIEDANKLLDKMVFESTQDWSSLRKELADIYDAGGLDEMADFVDPERSSS